MNGNGYQEDTGDRHREIPVAMPLGSLVKELNTILQNPNGGNHTMRGRPRCASQSASATGTGAEILGRSAPSLMVGGTLRRKKPPVAKPPQEKKKEQEVSGANNELANILNRRRRKNWEDLSKQNVKTLDNDHHETKEVKHKPLSVLKSSEQQSKIEKPHENSVPPQEILKPQVKPILIGGDQSKQTITTGFTIAGTQAIEQTAQGFQQQFSADPSTTNNVPEATISRTATRLLHDEEALCVTHKQNHTRVDSNQAAGEGIIQTKVEAFQAHEKPGAIQNQREGLNIGELPNILNRGEEKQDDTEQGVKRLQDEHTRMESELKLQQEELKCRLELVPTTQKSVPRNDRDAEIKDLRSRLEVAHEHVAKQIDTIVQMTFDYEALQKQMEEVESQEIVKYLEGKVELYHCQVRQYENDLNEERAARERAAGEQESQKRRHQFEMQVLEDNLKEAVESERTLKQHATTELDELRRKQTGLEAEFNKALAIQTSQLDAAQAEKAEIRQQNDGLNHKIKQYETDIQQFLAHKESTHELRGKIGELECDVRGLTVNLERKKNENQTLGITVQQLKEQIQQLEARDELAPYVLPRLPYLGECQGAGSYGSVYRIHLNGINCIAKQIHDILLGQGREQGVNIEDKQAAYQKFYTECVLLSRMRHPNIVQFMGVHYGPQRDYGKELTLVMERLYMNLEDCLKRYKNIEMWLKVSILLDISQGLLHLHSQGIVHRDLTAPNILLTTSLHAKIADLGVSKIINVHPLAASKQSMIPGTLGYMPPEALAEIPEYGSALDVFSFGVLILFVVLQEYPQYYDNLVTPEGLARKESHIQKRSKWINKLSSDNPFRRLICGCLQDVPEQRPTTNNLNSSLIQISKTYPNPYQDIIDMQTHLA